MKNIFNTIGSIFASLFTVFCPVCIGFVGSVFSALGLGALVTFTVFKPLVIGLIFLAWFGLFRSYRKHRNFYPFLASICGGIFVYIGRYYIGNNYIIYSGAFLLLGSMIWNGKIEKSCKFCKSSNI